MNAIHWKSRALIACLAVGSACGSDNPEVVSEMVPLEPTETWAGKTLEEWAIEYMRWYHSPTDCKDFPTDDTDGSRCDDYQDPDSEVFFFDQSPISQATPPLVERTKCRVPAGKAIFVPVARFFGDNADLPEDEHLSDDQSTRLLSDTKSTFRKLVLNADGVKIDRLQERSIGPIRFDYYVPAIPNRFGCDETAMVSDESVNPSFLVGTFVLFKPPAAGPHELEYSSTLTFLNFDYAFRVRNNFTIVD